MKTHTTKVLASLFLLVVILFIATDGMMTYFSLGRGIQYAFNLCAIMILIPFGLHFLLDMKTETV